MVYVRANFIDENHIFAFLEKIALQNFFYILPTVGLCSKKGNCAKKIGDHRASSPTTRSTRISYLLTRTNKRRSIKIYEYH